MKGPLPAGQHLPLVLVLPWDMGMSQHCVPTLGSTQLRLLGFTAGAGSLCANSRAFHSGSLWIRAQIWSELCFCDVCPKLKEMFILQNELFCQWLIPVHPCCHSRDPISVTPTKRNLCTKTSGPAWVLVTDAMLSNYFFHISRLFLQNL